jgi:hypothetical protein
MPSVPTEGVDFEVINASEVIDAEVIGAGG